MAIVIVGDASAINEQIKPYSEKIEYFDASGKAKEMNKQMSTEITSGVEGVWNLTVSSPQGDLPITMNVKSDNGNLIGEISTPIGDGTITGGSLNGNNISTTANVSFQGQQLEVKINGTIEGNSVQGNIAVPIAGFPELPFTGVKAS
jgi:hypothetical protein